MVDKIVNFIIGIFGASSGAMIGKYITVFVISLMLILPLFIAIPKIDFSRFENLNLKRRLYEMSKK